MKKKKRDSATNKQRDLAITELYQMMENMGNAMKQTHQILDLAFKRLDHYIDWTGRNGKRYRRSLKREAERQKELKVNDVQKNDTVNEQNLEKSTADQG